MKFLTKSIPTKKWLFYECVALKKAVFDDPYSSLTVQDHDASDAGAILFEL